MAYQHLDNIAWGSGPNITGTIAYDYQRSGADMQYRVKITINTLPYSSSYFGFPIYATIRLDGSTKVSGYQIKAASPSQWSSALVYETGWLTVSAKSSGTTSLSVNIYSGSGESRDYTYSYSLYVVPAASTMTVPAITLGSPATLTITPAASGLGYTHTITYKFGSATGTITSSTSDTSVSWTPSIDLASQIPNAASGTGTLTLDTYSGSTKIGSKDYAFTASVPASVKPTVSSVVLSDEAGYLSTFGAYVQGKSRLKLKATADQAYGSPIKSYTFIVDGKTTAATSSEVTVDLLSAGTISIIVRVTDGRGRVSTDYTTTITVLPYAAPQITTMTASRCKNENDGTPDPTGTYVNVVFSGAISALNNINTAVWKVGRKKPTDEYWTETTVTVSQKYAPNNVSTIISGVAANSPYIFRISATDTVTGTVTSVEIPVPAGYAFFRTNANLDGLSFGKEEVKPNTLGVAWGMEVDGELSVGGDMSVGGGLNVDGDAGVSGDMNVDGSLDVGGLSIGGVAVDYIVEQGTSGNWTYTKWNSGRAEFYGYVSINVPNGWSNPGTTFNYPIRLTEVNYWGITETSYLVDRCYLSGVSNGSAVVETHSNGSAMTSVFRILVKGRWK